MNRVLACLGMLAMVCSVLPCQAETLERALANVMQENFEAANHENLPRLLATMTDDDFNRERFIETCKLEWESGDTYYRLDDLRVLKTAQVKAPFAVAIVTQTITPMPALQAEKAATGRLADDAAHRFGVRTSSPTTRVPVLFKKVKGTWLIVAFLAEPEPVNAD